jgi:hypothetical protein
MSHEKVSNDKIGAWPFQNLCPEWFNFIHKPTLQSFASYQAVLPLQTVGHVEFGVVTCHG